MDKISIIYENKDLLVINKPAGISVHKDGKNEEYTVADWFLENYPESKDVGEPITLSDGNSIYRPGIVHRLDKDTSGVLVLVKNQEAHAFLKAQFKDRGVKKKYLAFVYGEIKDKFGIIDKPIGRSKNDFRKWSAMRGMRGELRDAITWYTVLYSDKRNSILLIEPKTGRTHQIRVHMLSIHHPIVSDTLYAPNREGILGFNRLALHAFSLEFKGLDGKTIKVEAPLPEDFLSAIKELGIAKNDLIC